MGNGADDRLSERDARIKAISQGYEPDPCKACGSHTLMPVTGGFVCDACHARFVATPAEDPDGIPLHSQDGC